MGFRDFHLLNKALLAKQAWRLLLNLDALWAKVMKATYFPFSSLLGAVRGRKSSWAWRSIFEGIEVLKCGLRWNVSSGKDILIWEDRWVPGLSSFKIASRRPGGNRYFLVSHLIDHERRMWKSDTLRSFLTNEEVNAIGNPNAKDTLVWHYTKDGNYSVKSGHHLLQKNLLSSQPQNSSQGDQRDGHLWKRIWELPVLPKIKHFLWRVCHNALATKENLARRLRNLCDRCPRCDEEQESVEHILFFCPFAQAVWRASTFSYCPNKNGFVSFKEWWREAVCSLLDFGSFSSKGLIACLYWRLWKDRNEFLFEGTKGNPISSWQRTLHDFQMFCARNFDSQSTRTEQRRDETWQKPPSGFIKINCDAAYSSKNGKAGIAAVARDERGKLIGGRNFECFSGSVLVAEAFAIRLGCILAINNKWKKVIIESDAEELILRLNGRGQSRCWQTLAIEEDIIRMMNVSENLSFSFVKRSANGVADWVARKTKQRKCPLNWFICPPCSFVIGLLKYKLYF